MDNDIEKISQFGDNGLINKITKDFVNKKESTIKGIGNDAAVIDNGDRLTLVSNDLLLQGIHFNLIYYPLKHLGYKAIIRGISDIYAMNGTPNQIILSIGFSGKFPTEAIEELYEGARIACERYKVDLVGGDTTGSLTGLTISVTAIGSVDKKDLVTHDGANTNDLICVTGDLGSAYIGLQILEREKRIFESVNGGQPDLSDAQYVIGRQLKPEIPIKTLETLREAGVTFTSMIDVTNGLASDIMQICKASAKGCKIFQDRIPIDYETIRLTEELNLESLIPALNGGDDFEMLFTVPLSQHNIVDQIKNVTVIGHITDKDTGMYLVGAGETKVHLSAPGWSE